MFTRNTELEWLLANYRDLQALLEELNIEARSVASERPGDEDEIYSQLTKRNIDGMPFATFRVSDRTAAAVIDRYKTSMRITEEIEKIQQDILLVSAIIMKIDIGVRALHRQERLLIEQKYFHYKTWKVIAQELKCSPRALNCCRDRALQKMITIVQINLEDCRKIKSMLEWMREDEK